MIVTYLARVVLATCVTIALLLLLPGPWCYVGAPVGIAIMAYTVE